MSDHPTERLSEYIDGDLEAAERAAVENHIEGCSACRALVADLQTVAERARALEDRAPENDLWPAVRGRLDSADREPEVVSLAARRRAKERRLSFTLPQLAAAAVALIIVSASATWWARSDQGPPPGSQPIPSVTTDAPATNGVLIADLGDLEYSTAIAELTRVFEASRDRLDPETVRTVEANVAAIDRAIKQITGALRADPNSSYLYDYLVETRQRKLQVLRQAADIAQTST